MRGIGRSSGCLNRLAYGGESGRANDREPFVIARADDRCGGRAEPVFKQTAVDRAEVDSVFEIAVVEIAQVRFVANQAGIQTTAEQPERGGGAVVGAERGVFRDSPAELG